MTSKWLFICLLVVAYSCKKNEGSLEDQYHWTTLKVTATAYNSVKNQTDSDPHITAFGDSLKPGMKYIAVSRDLYQKGLKRNTPVKIKGLEGIYWVKDRMHSRWRNKIDIYMGLDIDASKKWGRNKVEIEYGVLINDTISK